MALFTHCDFDDHEQVMFVRDSEAKLKAIIAIHDTRLGPALGGCRIWRYESESQALTDVLRLARGMSYKAALADLALGGGKSVILADSRSEKTPEMMRAMGRAVDSLGGRYIAAEDVGATVADMDEIAKETTHVSGVSGGAGDPSPWTAEGVFLCIQGACQHLWGSDVEGRTVSVQGLGSVGANLCQHLSGAGAQLVVSDLRVEVVDRLVQETGATPIPPDAAHAAEADIFAPCALGAGLNEKTIPEVQATLVCGAANNQLATAEDGARLAARGITYAPDYLVNAGGLISVARPALSMSEGAARTKLLKIPDTLSKVFQAAERTGRPPSEAADSLARSRFRPTT